MPAGTIVSSGALVSPGGQQGLGGPTGPQGPSDGPYVIGASTALAQTPSGIVVPRFANHPDAIWTYGTFDDHFDAASLDPKWTVGVPANPLSQPVSQLAGSKFSLGGYSANPTNGIVYNNWVYQALPATAPPFTISLRWDLILVAMNTATSSCYVAFRIYNNASATGVELDSISVYVAASQGASRISFFAGANVGTNLLGLLPIDMPQYIRAVCDASYNLTFSVSFDGQSWMYLSQATAAQSGFSASVKPTHVWFLVSATNGGRVMMQLDWIKLTYP